MFELKQLPTSRQQELPQKPFHEWRTEEDALVTAFYRLAGGFLLRFPERADFTIDLEQEVIACASAPETSERVLTALFHNQVIPLVRSHEGKLVIHASASAIDGLALGFLGPSGRGKSTLATGFAQAGFPFLTDDGLTLEKSGDCYLAQPNQPFVRLWPDSEAELLGEPSNDSENGWKEKNLIDAGNSLPFQGDSLPLKAIYVLQEAEVGEAQIEKLKPSAALSALVEHSFILDVEDKEKVRTHFDAVSQLANSIPCFTLAYPRSYQELGNVIGSVITHNRELQGCRH